MLFSHFYILIAPTSTFLHVSSLPFNSLHQNGLLEGWWWIFGRYDKWAFSTSFIFCWFSRPAVKRCKTPTVMAFVLDASQMMAGNVSMKYLLWLGGGLLAQNYLRWGEIPITSLSCWVFLCNALGDGCAGICAWKLLFSHTSPPPHEQTEFYNINITNTNTTFAINQTPSSGLKRRGVVSFMCKTIQCCLLSLPYAPSDSRCRRRRPCATPVDAWGGRGGGRDGGGGPPPPHPPALICPISLTCIT